MVQRLLQRLGRQAVVLAGIGADLGGAGTAGGNQDGTAEAGEEQGAAERRQGA
ncbi:hypothetical protein X922_19935 [Pseudomonas aeruginosa VRFPA08]|nr:hypothetical protein X922_19935 [Pseudomonas aeruginosa VRFPA08]